MDDDPVDPPGNVGLAVGPDVTYVRCRIKEAAGEAWTGAGGANVGEEVILAKDLMKEVLRHHVEVVEEFPGSTLVGRAYEPLFPGPCLRRVDNRMDRFGGGLVPQPTGPAWFTPP